MGELQNSSGDIMDAGASPDSKFKQLSPVARETKLAIVNKMLAASNDMKDRVIRDLRTEIIEKA